MNIKTILILIPVVLVAIFILQNTRVVEVKILFWTVAMSRALMLLGTLVIGLVAGWLLKTFIAGKSSS